MNSLTNITKEFEGTGVEIIISKNGDLEFELYSTGMALGQTKIAKGLMYPRRDRIDANIKSAEIKPVVHNGQQYLTESMLYDLMLEMKTEKVKPFRKWITGEVLPSIRRDGGYILDSATPGQVEKLVNKYASKYCTEKIHDAKSVREYIRNSNKMMLKFIVDEIANVTEPMKASILKEKILKSAIKELDRINEELQYDTLENTYIKNTCETGARELTDILLDKKARRISLLESKIS